MGRKAVAAVAVVPAASVQKLIADCQTGLKIAEAAANQVAALAP